ncbi:MAG TPA: peptidylprolyl isomerase [Chitinophagaceae bacterium]|nr:peptidylprolyl isomerase [Chitinophagaceae bacterium]
MKVLFSALLLLVSGTIFAQLTVREQFEKIKTVQDAEKYIAANPNLKPALLTVVYGKDTTLLDKRLLKQNKGDVFSVGYVTYKVLEVEEAIQYRASYVFLDRGSLNNREIDSLSKIIVQKHSAGTPFEQLADQYTMDGNTTHGDLGWFFGEDMVPKELQDAVSKHKLGEVFFVDVPERQWYYIVKKTYDDQIKKEIKVLRSNGR